MRRPPEPADPLGPFEVGQHENEQKLGVRSWAERVEARLEPTFELIAPHRVCLRRAWTVA